MREPPCAGARVSGARHPNEYSERLRTMDADKTASQLTYTGMQVWQIVRVLTT